MSLQRSFRSVSSIGHEGSCTPSCRGTDRIEARTSGGAIAVIFLRVEILMSAELDVTSRKEEFFYEGTVSG